MLPFVGLHRFFYSVSFNFFLHLLLDFIPLDFTLTPTQWVKKTGAVGMYVKQGKGGGVMAHPDIASDFRMWLDPSLRLALVKFMREQSEQKGSNQY